MTVSTIRPFLAVPITGSGLDAAEQRTLVDRLGQGSALADAIRSAVERARAAGVDAFAPDESNALLLPTGLSVADRQFFFNQVIARPYSGADKTAAGPAAHLPEAGPLSLDDWSRAVEALALRVAQDASRLPPGAGGGARLAYGAWFINGERYTLAELFVAVRLGNVALTETYLAGELDALARNGRLARDLLDVLSQMKRYRAANPALRSEISKHLVLVDPKDPTAYQVQDLLFDTGAGYADFVKAAHRTLKEIADLGKTLNPKGLLKDTERAVKLNNEDYAALMTEVQAVFDSVNADNQVKQIRVQTIENTRLNQLLSVSSFLNGSETAGKAIVRGL